MFNRQVSNIFMSTCLTYIHNLYIKLYLSKSKKREPNSKSYTPHVHSLWRSYESRKKNKKIRRDPSLVIWLDIYCPQNKMFVFCCDMYSCHCPPPKSKSRSVFNQNGFNGKNEATHCSNKKAREIRAIFPSGPPHYSPTYFCYCGNLEIQRSIIERIFIWLTDVFRSKWKKHYEKTDNKLDLYEAVETLRLFISATSRLLSLFLLIHFCYLQSGLLQEKRKLIYAWGISSDTN